MFYNSRNSIFCVLGVLGVVYTLPVRRQLRLLFPSFTAFSFHFHHHFLVQLLRCGGLREDKSEGRIYHTHYTNFSLPYP